MGMINQIKSFIKDATTKRSDAWPEVEKTHLRLYPTCAACASKVRLNVHHKKPFHLDPNLELDPRNLITLCMDPAAECHIKIGHGDNFRAYNPNVDRDARAVLQGFMTKERAAQIAKANRLFA